MSRYATVLGPSTRSDPIGPFGETLTWPSAASGALPTKYIGWLAIHVARRSSIVSYSRAIAGVRAPTPSGRLTYAPSNATFWPPLRWRRRVFRARGAVRVAAAGATASTMNGIGWLRVDDAGCDRCRLCARRRARGRPRHRRVRRVRRY